MNIIEKISKDLNVPGEMLTKALVNSRKLVKLIKIKKADGSFRTAYQPSKHLKVIQYWLDDNMFKSFKVHSCATAYKKGTSIKLNALRHKNGKFFIKLDFKNFFPSIKFDDFSPFIKEWNNSNCSLYNEQTLLLTILQACFYKENCLPIGYPTSPIISNIVMFNFDSKIFSIISDKNKYGDCTYTRYADDITFSTNLKGACTNFHKLIKKEIKTMQSPTIIINESKTRYVSATGGSAMITGLRICHDRHITIHRKYKNKIRQLIYSYDMGYLNEDEILSLRGHLFYVRHVDSPFYTKLQKNYFKSIDKILSIKVDFNT